MPHISIEYSASLDAKLDIDALIRTLHEAALATGLFEVAAVRTRARRFDHCLFADGDPANGFIAVTVRMGHGRPLEKRQALGEALFKAASSHLEPLFAAGPLGLSLEVQEIDPVLNFKRNNLHARLAKAREDAA